MDRLDQGEHLDRQLADRLALAAREAVRDELREQSRTRRRATAYYAASGAVALYAGAALALALGLVLAAGMPDWAAALVTAVILGVVAHLLRGAAHRPGTGSVHGGPDDVIGGSAPAAPPSGLGTPYPTVPPTVPSANAGVTGTPAPIPQSGIGGRAAPRQDDIDPEASQHL
ncbi:phage holin family protein [Streptomyces sp. NPDC090306]|uniref:phage holin family protein n=1 Tax=Streptomyces sp. NPDC090306 TaxID=3365961 RepID=UPI00380D1C6E